jgi:ERCC4-related helicase
MAVVKEFSGFFEHAAGTAPFDYQQRFATNSEFATPVNVSTGLGKTVVASHLY